jgi:hypothetical protein
MPGPIRGRDEQVTVLVPGPSRLTFRQRLRVGRTWSGLAGPLRELENVSVVVVRDHGGAGHTVQGRLRVLPRSRHVAVILVGTLDRSVLKAVRYARAIEAADIRAVHAAVDPDRAEELTEQWGEVGPVLGIPLDVEECFDRNIASTVRNYVDRVKSPDAEVSVILPRREYPRVAQRLLHDHTSRAITRALQDEGHVDVVVVPYRVEVRHGRRSPRRKRRSGLQTR